MDSEHRQKAVLEIICGRDCLQMDINVDVDGEDEEGEGEDEDDYLCGYDYFCKW